MVQRSRSCTRYQIEPSENALYSFEGARESNFKGQIGRRPGHRGGVAQLGEHLLCKQGVIGSNPFISTNSIGLGGKGSESETFRGEGLRPKGNGLIAQLVRAHA